MFSLSSEFKHMKYFSESQTWSKYVRKQLANGFIIQCVKFWITHNMSRMSWNHLLTSFLVVCLGRDRVFVFHFMRSCTRELYPWAAILSGKRSIVLKSAGFQLVVYLVARLKIVFVHLSWIIFLLSDQKFTLFRLFWSVINSMAGLRSELHTVCSACPGGVPEMHELSPCYLTVEWRIHLWFETFTNCKL